MSKQVVQSYASVMLRGKFTTYQMRIFMQIVKASQKYMAAKGDGNYTSLVARAYADTGRNIDIACPVSDIVGKSCHNWSQLRKDVKTMARDMIVEYYDIDKKVWRMSPIISNVEIGENNGMLIFTVPTWIRDYICQFEPFGYRSYELETAMKLKNPNTQKLYLLVNSMNKPIRYELSNIKKWLGVGDKYRAINDFCKRCLDPAKKELENMGVNGFDYERLKDGTGKTAKVTHILIKPIKRKKNNMKEKNIGEMKKELETMVGESILNYMATSLQFSYREMFYNRQTIADFVNLEGWGGKFLNIVDRARRGRKTKGYIIAAMKREVKGK